MLPVAILAGGYGRRLGRDGPKALAEVAGRPFVLHQLRLLADAGVTDVVICVGYRGDEIIRAVGYDRFGVRVRYSDEGGAPVGTLRALRGAASLLGDRFLYLYGDAYLRVDYGRVARAWEHDGAPAMMTIIVASGLCAPNVWARGRLVIEYGEGTLDERFRHADYGLGGLTAGVLYDVGEEASDLHQLHIALAGSHRLYAYRVRERFYEIGTPESLGETDRFLRGRARPGPRPTAPD